VVGESRALEVTYVSPKGQQSEPHTQITVSFNKPMVSLEAAEDRGKTSPLILQPAVAGTQRWLGSRTLTFRPDGPLPGSSVFQARVARGTKALDGTVLEKEVSWSFATPLLEVSRVVPAPGAKWERPDTTVELYFNQPVSPRTLEKHAALTIQTDGARADQVTAVAVKVRQGKNSQHMVLHPATALPLDARVALVVDQGMASLEGSRPTGAAYRTTFHTYGPLRVLGLSCTKDCDPEQSLEVRFSNPVPADEARRTLRVNGTPLPKASSTYAGTSFWIHQASSWKPRTKYRVTIGGPMKDQFGQFLADRPSFTFVTGDLAPYARLPLESGVLEASGKRNLPLFFCNAEEAQLRSRRMDPAEVASYLGHPGLWDLEKPLLATMDGAQTQSLQVAGQRNARITRRVNLNALLGGKTKGVLALELESRLTKTQAEGHPGGSDRSRALVRVTDLAVTAKFSPHTSVFWVTSLAGGRPVSGCTVSIWRVKGKTPLWSGTTDTSGLALAPGVSELRGSGREAERLLFFAEKDGDTSFVDSQTQSGIRAWDFGFDETWDDDAGGLLGMLFTDRGIYRPGETVQVKGILRRSGEKKLVTPRGAGVKLAVSDSRGERLAVAERKLSEFGSFSLEVKLPVGAPLGSYGVTGATEGGGTVYGQFRVEEYRPAEFKVAVTSEHRAHVRGDTLTWSSSADYLFGSPMRQAEMRWSLDGGHTSYAPPGHEGYIFSDEASWWGEDSGPSNPGLVAQGKGKLDDRGRISGAIPLRPPKMTGPQSYELEVTVTDVSRQNISTRTSVLLHPGELYVGAKPKETFLSAGKSLEAEVVAVTPEGKTVRGVPLEGTLYLRSFTSVRKEGMGGAHYFVSRPVETEVGGCKLVSEVKPGRCEVKIDKAGYYVLRLRAKDKRGNPVGSSFGAYVSGSDYVAWKRDNESRVELVTDRKEYKVGQVAKILVKSPFAGAQGLLTVERNGIYTRRAIKVDRTAAWLEVPITDALVPTAYVSVMLVRGRIPEPRRKAKTPGAAAEEERPEEDPGRPTFKVGYARLNISEAKHALKVDLHPARPEYRPGEEVVLDLSVKDAAGKGLPAELTVFAADEGVLRLIGYGTPDPMAVFYAARGLSVRTADNRIQLISQRVFGEKGKNPGGGGAGEGSGGEGVRRHFVSTPYFNPAVITDDKGRAQVRFKLPDNLTTFRIMAVAASREAEFGSSDTLVKVNKPLLLLPTLPRLVRVGDHIEAGVVVHNRGSRDGQVKVEATVQGMELEGPRQKTIAVKGGGSAEARFSMTAVTPGEATFRFRAVLEDQQDVLELKRKVVVPLVIESVAAFGSTETGVSEAIAPSEGVRGDVGGLDVALSSSALVGLKPAMEYLVEYPYECLEQTTSRMVPLVLLHDLRTAFGIATQGDPRTAIALAIARVERMQRWDGGFSYWPSGYDSYPWVSAYATWGLLKAKAAGHAVSQRVLDRAKAYLREQLNRPAPQGSERLQRNIQAYLVHVLAELGEKPAAYVSNLYEKRGELAEFSKALLLSAMIRQRSDARMIGTLTEELLSHVHQTPSAARVEENLGDGYAPLFHSDNRSTALVLQALLQVRPGHPLVEKMVAHLLAARRQGHWRSTQETAHALLALHTYFTVREKGVPSFVAKLFLGEAQLLEREFRGRSLAAFDKTVPMKDLKGEGRRALGFVKEGTGRLYYSARLRYARQQLPKDAWDEGFYVTRTYERVSEDPGSFAALRGEPDAAGPGVREVKAGDLVRVTLRIVAPQHMDFVAVDDPLPAGLEAVNFRLMTSARAQARQAFAHFQPAHRRVERDSFWFTPFYHQEIRDDRVQLFADDLPAGVHTYVYLARATTIGKFVAAPTHVEQMYSPEVFGRTGSGTLEVKATN
jgi:hypothetical protein